MAATVIDQPRPKATLGVIRGRVIDTVTTAPSTSAWWQLQGRYPVTVCVGGSATTIGWQVLVSNQASTPSGVTQAPVGGAQDAMGTVVLSEPYEWILVQITTIAGGNAFAEIFAG